MWIAKYPLAIENIIGVGEHLVFYSKTELYINTLYTTVLKKSIAIEQLCLLNNHSLLLLGNQAFILSLITLEMRQIKFKLNKKTMSDVISDGATVSMILNSNEVVVYKIE